jgi:hypothetical protein
LITVGGGGLELLATFIFLWRFCSSVRVQTKPCMQQSKPRNLNRPRQQSENLTISEMMTTMMSRMRYQCWPIHFRTEARLSSDSSSFRSVASGPEGSTWKRRVKIAAGY